MKPKPSPGEIRVYEFLRDLFKITSVRSNGNDIPANPYVSSNIQLVDSDLSVYRIHMKGVDIVNLGDIYRRCTLLKDANFVLIVRDPEYRNHCDCDVSVQLKFTSSTADRILLKIFNNYNSPTMYLYTVIKHMYSEIWSSNAPLEEFL